MAFSNLFWGRLKSKGEGRGRCGFLVFYCEKEQSLAVLLHLSVCPLVILFFFLEVFQGPFLFAQESGFSRHVMVKL